MTFELKAKYEAITSFLRPYRELCLHEILIHYPHILQEYPKEWFDILEHLSLQQKFELDSGASYQALEGTPLHALLSEIDELSKIVSIPLDCAYKLEREKQVFIKSKKRHEIERIITGMQNLGLLGATRGLVDIGGGHGHFARVLTQLGDIHALCIDGDSKLLDKAVFLKNKTQQSCAHHRLSFRAQMIEKGESLLTPDEKEKYNLSFGLHTCGNLALKQMDFFLSSGLSHFLNFGCCYLKLNPSNETGLSHFSKKFNRRHSDESLTLATRGHNPQKIEAFEFKFRVKSYRYALHLLLAQEYGVDKFISVGDGTKELYRQDFANYAAVKLTQCQIALKHTPDSFNHFFNREQTQDEIKRIFHAGLIRWRFGRLLELEVLLDRALYLEEKGYKARLYEFFDPALSPRNIGIVAHG